LIVVFSPDNVNSHELVTSAIEPGTSWRDLSWDSYTHRAALDHGAELNYVDIGVGPGPTLLLVHGLGGSWKVWLENILPFAHDHRVIAVDLPGFGDSAVPTSCTYAAYADTLARFCRHLGLTSVVVAGNSFGGWVSTELALRHPDLVVGLAIIDGAGIVPTRGERLKVVNMMRTAGRMAPLGVRFKERVINSPKNRKRAFGFIIARADLLPPDLATVLMPERTSPVFATVIDEAVRSWSQDWCDLVAKLDTPSLVVWGAVDKQLPLRHAKLWHRMLVDSELVVVPGAGHMPMLESPRIVNDAIRRLLHRFETEPAHREG
jgi:pimeloyl-ACP methyl ester carboxylesterase